MKVSAEIEELVPYSPGKPISETKRELGLSEVHKLASNESPIGPSPEVIAAMTQSLSELHRYPDSASFELKIAMSKYLGIEPNRLTFGNGSNELIDLLIRVFCEPGDEILTSQAAFLAYPLCAQAARVKTRRVPLTRDGRFDLPGLAKELTLPGAERIRMIFIANPNNPTGTYVRRHEFEELMKIAGLREDLLVVVDEAYFEFVRAKDTFVAQEYAVQYKNLAYLRTMSKAFGLAGLRLGALVADPQIIDYVNRVRNPFNINSLAQVGACAALADKIHLKKVCQLTWEGLDYFYKELDRLGLKYWPSQANFVLFDTQRDAQMVFRSLLRRGVIVRPVENYGFYRLLRMSVGTSEENRLAIAALESVLKEVPVLPMVVTIDGPAASGKTSVSRELADRLGWRWVSTGAFYRGLAYVAQQLIGSIENEAELVELSRSTRWKIHTDRGQTQVFLDGQNVSEEIYKEKVGEWASRISQFPKVRASLLEAQRACAMGVKGLIAEGRDCGTVVFPGARVKIYLDASQADRAQRRAQEQDSVVETVKASQARRDRHDQSRRVAPLQISPQAYFIDTSDLVLEEVVKKVEGLIREDLKL